ncbi:hypothetical protein OAD71_00105 [Gammaproteobacteria bacterium]|jgi:hypothetical protein|nr:hypothetical protein [Gammaproteobacteria bacterium]
MKNNTLVTALLAAIAGAFLFYLFNQYFEITPKNTQQLTENAEQIVEKQTPIGEIASVDTKEVSPVKKVNSALVMRCIKESPIGTSKYRECMNASESYGAMIHCYGTVLDDRQEEIYVQDYPMSSNKDLYRGQLNSDCNRHGQGTYMYTNGSEFVGTHSNGKRVRGSTFYPDGGVRHGETYINDKLHGSTKYYFADGQVNQETWRNGKSVGNVMIEKGSKQIELEAKIAGLEAKSADWNARQQDRAYQNNQKRDKAIGNWAKCLGTPGENMATCSNAWQGYTPPAPKKVYKCDYDTFGNRISSTCREQ